MSVKKIVKSSQEQAVGAWINYLNQVRLDRLVEALSKQSDNLATAMKTMENAFATIKGNIIVRNRGGEKGMHGFIAEIAECGIGNARKQIVGKAAEYVWINDNGPVDLQRAGLDIQQKFSQAGGNLSLRAITEHIRAYSDYIAEGGIYQIPKDHYDKIMAYRAMSADVANKLPTSSGDFSLRQWKMVNDFFATNDIDINKIEPSVLEYKEVQAGAITDTFDREAKHLEKVDREQRDIAYHESKPSLAEGAKATVVGAVAEGATAFTLNIVQKRKTGKKFSEFNEQDWLEIAGDTGKGAVKGGIRGASLYMLTNYTVTPAAVATALTTAAFGVAEQAHLLRSGTIDEVQFIENAETLCLDATVSALASFAGQVLIPIPVLGAIIGNAVGMMIYQIGEDSLSTKEREIIDKYLEGLAELDEKLAVDYREYIKMLNQCYADYMELLTLAFDPDVERALEGSVALAKRMGVSADEILDDYDKIVDYFMN